MEKDNKVHRKPNDIEQFIEKIRENEKEREKESKAKCLIKPHHYKRKRMFVKENEL